MRYYSHIPIIVVLGPQVISQLFGHNSNGANCEWLIVTYIVTHGPTIFCFINHMLPCHNCDKL